MQHGTDIVARALVSGSVAGVVAAAALALLAKRERKPAIQPLNATSHWLHGDRAGGVRRLDLQHSGVGYATHHASTIFWALLFETARARSQRSDAAAIARDAAAVAGLAAIVDYGLVPKRLTPGWEHALSTRSVAGGFVGLAAGLFLGGLWSGRAVSVVRHAIGAQHRLTDRRGYWQSARASH